MPPTLSHPASQQGGEGRLKNLAGGARGELEEQGFIHHSNHLSKGMMMMMARLATKSSRQPGQGERQLVQQRLPIRFGYHLDFKESFELDSNINYYIIRRRWEPEGVEQ